MAGFRTIFFKGDCTQKSVDRCPARTNGALIRIDVVGEFFTTWTTNDAFIDQAIKLLEENKTQVEFHPSFFTNISPLLDLTDGVSRYRSSRKLLMAPTAPTSRYSR